MAPPSSKLSAGWPKNFTLAPFHNDGGNKREQDFVQLLASEQHKGCNCNGIGRDSFSLGSDSRNPAREMGRRRPADEK